MGCRGASRLRRPSERALDFVDLGLALNCEQRDLEAPARLALEWPAIERRPVVIPGLQQAEGNHAAVPVGAERQQG